MSSVIKYRPEIDGLRAIAVLAVIVFHFNSIWLPGGFTGVDVFFVLSGYLITTISCRELDSGTFSIASFYLRRVKRILPPLYAVLCVVVLAGFVLLTASDFAYLKSSVNYIIPFASNIYFSSAGDYFAPTAAEMPLLHTWSLAVEEQFYFIWPVMLVLIYKWSDRLRLGFLTGLALISFGLAEYFLRTDGMVQFAYYSLVTRFGELLAGAILALFLKRRLGTRSLPRGLGLIFAAMGSLLLVCGFVLLNKKAGFPGLNALYPVFGTLLLLLSFSRSDVWTTRWLSMAPAVYVGKLSYSLYLWHWPVLAYMRYVFGQYDLPVLWSIVAVLLIIVFSVASYVCLEKPVRSFQMSLPRALLVCFVVPSTILVMSVKVIQNAKNANIVEARYLTYGGSELCHGRISDQCVRGMVGMKPTVLVFGDSHAAQLNYFFDELGKAQGFSSLVLTASSCGPAFEFSVENLPGADRSACVNLLSYVRDNYMDFDVIVVAGRWELQFGLSGNEQADRHFAEKFNSTLELLSTKRNVVLVNQIPLLNSNPWRVEKVRSLGIPMAAGHSHLSVRANELLLVHNKNNEKIRVIDLAPYFSSFQDGVYSDGMSVYMDNNHLNQYGASLLGKAFADVGQFEVLVK